MNRREIYKTYKANQKAKGRKVLSSIIFNRIVTIIGLESIHLINTGYKHFTFGSSTGKIYLKAKPVYNKVMDRGKSRVLLIKLATTLAPHLLKQHTKGIYMAKLVKDMKPYVYNKQERPNAPKWICFKTKEIEVWYHWSRRGINMPNAKMYAFRPTNTDNFRLPGSVTQVPVTEYSKYLSIDDLRYQLDVSAVQKKNICLELDKSLILRIEKAIV